MKRIFNYDSWFYNVLLRLTDLVILNGVFLLGSLPLFTIGASSSAMYSVTLKWARGQKSDVIKDFTKAYKENFKSASIVWLILLIFGLMMGFNIWLFGNSGKKLFDVLQIVNLFLLILLLLIVTFIFPIIAQFENTISNHFKNSIMMMFSNFGRTLLIILLLISVIFIVFYNQLSFSISLGFFILMGFAVVARWLSTYFIQIFNQYIKL